MFAYAFAATLPLLALSSAIPGGLLVSRQSSNGVVRIHPSSDNSKCLDVSGNIHENNRAVDIYACNDTPAQNWIVPVAGGPPRSIMLNGTNFCLDAGNPPFSTRQMKIYQCYDGLVQQNWVYTPDEHFALYNQNPGFCLAATDSSNTNAQVAPCGGNFQQWTTTS